MKRWLSLILAAALAVCVFAACSKDDNTSGSAGKHHVEIEVQDYGTIAVELDGDAAPITVDNFLKLAKEGFYDGLTFHRIIDGFMIQGGDPEGTGMGGSVLRQNELLPHQSITRTAVMTGCSAAGIVPLPSVGCASLQI